MVHVNGSNICFNIRPKLIYVGWKRWEMLKYVEICWGKFYFFKPYFSIVSTLSSEILDHIEVVYASTS